MVRSALLFMSVTLLWRSSPAHADDPEGTVEAPPVVSDAEARRTCQVCPGRPFGFDLTIPLWLPLAVFSGEAEEADTPHRLSFSPGLTFAFIGEINLRLGPTTTERSVVGAGLGSHPVVALGDTEREP